MFAQLFKSRLVSRGDLEETISVRTDSRTCDIERLNILLSWVSCERLTVKSGDITNAYFQGFPLEECLMLISVRTPCSSRAFQCLERVMLAVVLEETTS